LVRRPVVVVEAREVENLHITVAEVEPPGKPSIASALVDPSRAVCEKRASQSMSSR
jgi:hypothetical protein